MITYLRLENFRRHAHTELHFDARDQLILISGANGVGKSTLLEAMLFAFYGESRHGKRHLDRLVRRGAELEGVEAECVFDVEGTEYRVVRRRDNKMTTALLYGNAQALTQGTDAVTQEITRVLGMDAVGFRLAVVAQQKQLDGLASLRAHERVAMLSRLLRLDALGRARDRARATYRFSREVLAALGPEDDYDALRAEVAQHAATSRDLEKEHAAVTNELARIVAREEELSDVARTWHDLNLERSRLRGTLDALTAEIARVETELASVEVGEEIELLETSLEVRALQTVLADAQARAEANARLVAQLAMLERERIDLVDALEALENGIGEEVHVDESALARAKDALEHARSAVAAKELAHGRTLAELERARAALEESATLGARCDHCGQTVDEEHRRELFAERSAAVAALEEQVHLAESERNAAKKDETRARDALAAVEDDVAKARAEASERAARLAQRAELEERQRLTTEQIDRLGDVDEPDLDGLARERVDLASRLAAALAREDAARVREEQITRRATLARALEDAWGRFAQAERDFAAAEPSEDLTADHEQLVVLEDARRGLEQRQSALSAQLDLSRERQQSAERRCQEADARRDERRRREHEAVVAANAADVLEVLASTMATRVRPVLEGAIGDLLATLTDGRYSKVELARDYALSVVDDGTARPLSDFSGGEIDLIALAMRLALSVLITERSGRAPGFLILDEVFGSQDATRRLAITTALRNLRHVYGQVFLISHVGGLEEEADVVLELERVTHDDEPDSVSTLVA